MHLQAVIPALLHVADIHFVLQNAVDSGVCPIGGGLQPVVVAVLLSGKPLILAGAGDALLVQLLGDADLAHPVFKQGEDAPHHLRRRRVDDQAIVVLRVFAVAVAGECSDELAPLLLGPKRALDLLGDVPCVLRVEQVLQRHHHVVRAAGAINVVCDGDEAHAVLRQPALQVAACLDVIAAKARQILYQYAADAPTFHIPQHPLKGRTLEIRAGVAVVGVAFHRGQVRVIFNVLLQQLPLVADGVALHPVSVLPGQAAVKRGGYLLFHAAPPFICGRTVLRRLCVGADQLQKQCLCCLLAKEVAGNGDRRGRCLFGVWHKQTSYLGMVHRMRRKEIVCLAVGHKSGLLSVGLYLTGH